MAKNRIKVKIEGGQEILDALKRMGADVPAEMESAALAGGDVVAEAANGMAPEPKITTEVVEVHGSAVTVAIGFPDDKWYWRYLETGATAHEITGTPLAFEGDAGVVVVGGVQHPGMAARPFLRPALDSQQERAKDAVGEQLKSKVRW